MTRKEGFEVVVGEERNLFWGGDCTGGKEEKEWQIGSLLL
jgi:hypothetical protein